MSVMRVEYTAALQGWKNRPTNKTESHPVQHWYMYESNRAATVNHGTRTQFPHFQGPPSQACCIQFNKPGKEPGKISVSSNVTGHVISLLMVHSREGLVFSIIVHVCSRRGGSRISCVHLILWGLFNLHWFF